MNTEKIICPRADLPAGSSGKGAPDLAALDDLWSQGFGADIRMAEGMSLRDYWHAPATAGWANKPHRFLYDLVGEVLHLRKALADAEARATKAEGERARAIEPPRESA